MDEIEIKSEQVPEIKTLTEDITEFNKKLDIAIEDLHKWKTHLFSLQEEFVEKLKKKTLSMKIQ